MKYGTDARKQAHMNTQSYTFKHIKTTCVLGFKMSVNETLTGKNIT